MNDKSIINGESIANMKHNDAILGKHIFNDNLGLDEVVDAYDKNLDKRTIRPPKERTKTSLTSLPSLNLIQQDLIPGSGKRVTLKHTINIIETSVMGNEKEKNDLPSAASTHSHGGSRNSNNNNILDVDFVDGGYVDRGSNLELVSPSSQIINHMHNIRPTYIPNSITSTEKNILNPLFDPNFQPISSKTGKRWNTKRNTNKPPQFKGDGSNNKVLKSSFFPELPSLNTNQDKNGGNRPYRLNLPTYVCFFTSFCVCLFSF